MARACRSTLTSLLLIALAAGGAPSVWCAPAAGYAAARAKWNEPAEPFRVIGNIYYVGTRGLSSWLIRTPEGLIVIDGGLEESAPLIERNIATLGFRLRDVRYLLNSHAHFDHSGGLARLKRDSGAMVVASEGDRGSLESGTYLGSEDESDLRSPPVKVDRALHDGDTVILGGVTLTAHVTPGHTRGCTTWTMRVEDGDRVREVMFYGSTSVALNRLEPRPQYDGIVDDYRQSFARLGSMQADVFLGNHQEFFGLWQKRARLASGGPNPFVDPAELPAFVVESREDFERELLKQRAAGSAGP